MTDDTPSVADAVAGAEPVIESFEDAVKRAADLPQHEYDRGRKQIAKEQGVQVKTLDGARQALLSRDEGIVDLGLFEPEPWPEPVDGAALLDEITVGICRYLVLPDHAAEAVALWTVHAHAFDAWRHSPRLGVTAPEKGCGKSTLLDVLMCLVPRGVKTENLTTAAAFRMIDGYRPVLMADEFDSWLTGRNANEELRGIFNAGHAVGGRTFRCEGDNNELRAFKTFGPAALAGIGNLPPTLADRSIPIFMQRREPGQDVADFRDDRADHLREAASRAARWASDNFDTFKASDPALPSGVFNRLADNWRVLISIADAAGGKWPQVAREACKALGLKNADETLSIREQLLSDVRDIFEDTGMLALASKEVCDKLHDMEGQPWSEFGRRNNPITATQMARLLKPLGIRPRTIRPEYSETTARGYHLKDFEKAFAAYLPPRFDPTRQHNGGFPGGTAVSEPTQAEIAVSGQNGPKAAENLTCVGVLDQNAGNGRENVFGGLGDAEERAAIQQFDGEGEIPPLSDLGEIGGPDHG